MKMGRQGLRHVGRLRGRELVSRPSRGLGAADCVVKRMGLAGWGQSPSPACWSLAWGLE